MACSDPNSDIRGQGEWLLESVGISIGKFDPDLVAKIKAQNGEFIDYMRGLGVSILSPVNGVEIVDGPISVHGTYSVHPRPGDNIVLFGRGREISPTIHRHRLHGAGIHSNERGNASPFWLAPQDKPKEYGIVVARVSEDFGVWLRSYSNVHSLTGQWIRANLPPLPGLRSACIRQRREVSEKYVRRVAHPFTPSRLGSLGFQGAALSPQRRVSHPPSR